MLKNDNSFLLIPSFYGFVSFLTFYIIYRVNFLNYFEPVETAEVIFLLTIISFAASCLINVTRYRRLSLVTSGIKLGEYKKSVLYILYAIGYLGLLKYLFDMINAFGGVAGFLTILQSESNLVRNTITDVASIGVQMTYFGWFAIWLTFLLIRTGKLSKAWYLNLILILALNLLFIDRTRPVWLLFVLFAIFLITSNIKKLNIGKFLSTGLLVVSFFVLIFNQIGNWVGKKNEELKYGKVSLPIELQNVVFYTTGSYGYFSEIIKLEEVYSFSPDRTTYPLMKVLQAASLVDDVVPQINNYHYIPFPTNVGTFLEPFYRDGGYVYLIFGILLYSFGFDYVGYRLLRSGGIFYYVLWANIVFIVTIGFFTPKMASTGFWTVILLSIFFNRVFNKRRLGWKAYAYHK